MTTKPPPEDERDRTFAWIDRMKKLRTRYLRPGEKVLVEKIARYKPNAPEEGRTIANKFLADDIGQSERNVRRLKRKLRRKGLIDYKDEKGGFVGGRGNCTTYFLCDPASWFGQAVKGDKLLPIADPERGTNRAVKGDKLGRKGGQVGPETRTTLSATTTITTLPLTSGELATALGEGALARPPKPAADQELYWRTLQKEFGLEHVRFDRIAGGTVYLVARPSEATEIEQTLGERLLEYWRLFRPNVTRVRVLPLGVDADEAAPRQAAAGAT